MGWFSPRGKHTVFRGTEQFGMSPLPWWWPGTQKRMQKAWEEAEWWVDILYERRERAVMHESWDVEFRLDGERYLIPVTSEEAAHALIGSLEWKGIFVTRLLHNGETV